MHSYGLERARGLDGHNVVTSIMYEHQLDLQGALYWLAGYAEDTIAKFFSEKERLPSWGRTVDLSVQSLLTALDAVCAGTMRGATRQIATMAIAVCRFARRGGLHFPETTLDILLERRWVSV